MTKLIKTDSEVAVAGSIVAALEEPALTLKVVYKPDGTVEVDDYPAIDWVGWSEWPRSVDRPTYEEWFAAKARWKAKFDPEDMSDGNANFTLLIATYSRFVWWQYFYPEYKSDMFGAVRLRISGRDD